MTDDKQLERFRQAVEEKNEQAKQKAEAAPPPSAEQDVVPGEQPELHEPGRPQDTRDARAKSSRHGQVTADNWNQ
jgi:hypothetical protein